ncbi:MAG: ABC transporter ATP-binding protein [Desulfobacterales bacterium]|nr:ABC transporter ATP-binding protein [Desulfobacterales bacterium]MDD4073193.1 ABC transporter ATP-binding protein [Desulfobacterales bacterium]MDD4392245.1 ABC transporter ATP-binding protein [Desulfobacterales bacterium]
MKLIEITNLTHRFADGTIGLDSVSLTIHEGEFVVVAGQNGSGKTTLMRHFNGLLMPASGEVKIDGIAVSDDLKRARQLVGMVFQDADSQIVGETVYEDVSFGPENLGLKGQGLKRCVTDAMASVGISEIAEQRPHQLSGGQKRKLAIAGVLAMKPRVIIFDEPFSNLDYPGVKQVLQQILDLHQSGHTIILITHDLEKVIYHASRLVIMEKGKIVRDGIPEKVIGEVEQFGIRTPCAYRMGMETESWLR